MPAAQIDTDSALESLEDIRAQTAFGANSGSRLFPRNVRSAYISPGIERASPAREKSPVTTKRSQSVSPAAKRVPAPIVPTVAPRVVEDYSQFVDALRDRSNELNMTRSELDFLAGHQDGYSGKLLSQKHIKRFGFCSLGPTLGALGLKILLIEDTAQTAAIKARMTPRQRPVRATAPLADNETTERAAPCP